MRRILLGLSLCLAAIANANPSTQSADIQYKQQQAEIQRLQSQLEALDKELTIFKQISGNRMDMQDRRVGDLGISTNQQANYMAAISNVSTLVGLGITLIALAAGFLTYFSATRRATQEAKDAAEKWFNIKSASLNKEIEGLRQKALQAQQQVDDHALTTKQSMDKTAANTKKLHDELIAKASQQWMHSTQTQQSPEDIQAVQMASVALESKPEIEFTADEHFVRGLSEHNSKRFDSALANFEKALDIATKQQSNSEKIAKFLFAIAATNGDSGKLEEEISIYDDLIQRFSSDPNPFVQKQVAMTLVNKGVSLGKLGRHQAAIDVYDDLIERLSSNSFALREQLIGALFNKGVNLEDLGKYEDAIKTYDDLVQQFGSHTSFVMRERVAQAMINKGLTLGRLGYSKEELHTYDDLVQRFSSDTSPAVREIVVKALLNKSSALEQLGRKEEAIKVYELILETYADDSDPAIQNLLSDVATVVRELKDDGDKDSTSA